MRYPTNCPNCNQLIGYDETRLVIGCKYCGTTIDSLDTWDNEHQHAKMIALSGEHIKAGNWNEAIGLLSPISSMHPSDERIYTYLLTATTKDFSDLDVSEPNRSLARRAWDSLVRLNGGTATPEMNAYSKELFDKQINDLERDSSLTSSFLFGSVCVGILAAICFVLHLYVLTFLMICGVGCCLGLAGLIFLGSCSPINDWKPNKNPFR